MNSSQAKEILALYRPGTADAEDPDFADALQLCASDPELKRWFDEHCSVYTALRARLKQAPVPEGLKEQILAERKVIRTVTFSRRTIVLAGVAAVAVLTGLLSLLLPPREDISLSGYLGQMASAGLGSYGMDLETNDLGQIRAFLAQKNSADFAVPAGLEKNAKPTGCKGLAWHEKPVTMICFHSGKPLGPGETSDIFLFVTDTSNISGPPPKPSPKFAKVNRTMTASWSQDGKTYVLVVADGDEESIRKYL